MFTEGPVIKRFVIPLDSKIEKQLRKDDLLDAYGGCARRTSAGSRNWAVLPKRHDNSLFLRS